MSVFLVLFVACVAAVCDFVDTRISSGGFGFGVGYRFTFLAISFFRWRESWASSSFRCMPTWAGHRQQGAVEPLQPLWRPLLSSRERRRERESRGGEAQKKQVLPFLSVSFSKKMIPSGYYYPDGFIRAFSHTHMVGPGASDWGNFGVMVFTPLSSLFSTSPSLLHSFPPLSSSLPQHSPRQQGNL